MEKLRRDAHTIIKEAVAANLPGDGVRAALQKHACGENIYLAAVGKAAWTMAKAAQEELGTKIKKGVVVTKYGHTLGSIPRLEIIEAGHPLPDKNSLAGTQKILELAAQLKADDELLLLLSGGGSSLFECPLPGLALDDIIDVNKQLLASGAGITEINVIRKRLSAVKGGRFAQLCMPARIFTIAMSDVLGDHLDAIASGPAAPDPYTAKDAVAIAQKYSLQLNDTTWRLLAAETPKTLTNAETVITGSVRLLCQSAAQTAAELGYRPHIITTNLCCEANEAGRMAAGLAREIGAGARFQPPCAIILGGETVVHLQGSGKGGRNQELALVAAEGIEYLDGVLIFSFGSDGTDGPTDAAGGMVDGKTAAQLRKRGLSIADVLARNDSYHALEAVGSLIKTGPTGTNVNDLAMILCR